MTERQKRARDSSAIRVLTELVGRRSPIDLAIVAAINARELSADERERLREIVADEFVEYGLGPDDEPNSRGLLLDDIIAWLGHK